MGSAASTTGHSVDDLVRISPELVLVDPDLSRRVRPRLPLLFGRRRPPLPALRLDAGSGAPAMGESTAIAPVSPAAV
jgi:hypothetical protein